MKKSNSMLEGFYALAIFVLLCCATTAVAQNRIIVEGTVVDEKNEALPSATVKVKNSTVGSLTDMSGKFTITVPNENSILEVSYIGYITSSIKVGAQRVIKVKLDVNSKTLATVEVISIGYGAVSKEKLSGALVSVSTANVQEKGISNVQQLLQGGASGVSVSEVDGQPGASMNIEIRGVNSISGSTQPLYVVDGVPMDDASAILNINPNDIAEMNVLKDASASAIYGSRGNNGVILITTKKGKAGDAKVSANYSQKYSELYRFMPLLDGPTWGQLQNDFRTSRGFSTAYTADQLKKLPTYDHTHEVLQVGITKDANASVSGGDDKTKYYISGQVLSQNGIITSTNFRRFTGKINFERELTKNLNFNGQITYANSLQNGNVTSGLNGVVGSALRWSPTSPLLTPDGNYNYVSGYMYGTDRTIEHPFLGTLWVNNNWTDAQVLSGLGEVSTYPSNPLANIRERVTRSTVDNFMSNLSLRYRLNDNLSVFGRYAYTLNGGLGQTYQPTRIVTSVQWKGQAGITNSRATKSLYELTTNYNRNFGKNTIDAFISGSIEESDGFNSSSTARGFTQDVTQFYNMGAGEVMYKPTSGSSGTQMASLVSRFIYSYDSRYYATVSARYDGTSKFAEKNRWGLFPTISGSWNVNKEKFMKRFKFINTMKIRGGYGITGGQSSASYSTLETLSPSYVSFGETLGTGYSSAIMPNKDLTWEKNEQTNFGLDLVMFKNRLTFNVDAYYKITRDLLMTVDVPNASGFTTMWDNVGTIQNRGIEFSTDVSVFRSKKFNWIVSGNISFNDNKVLSINQRDGGFVAIGGDNGINGTLSRLVPGQRVGDYYGYEQLGCYTPVLLAEKAPTFQPTVKEGNRRYKDVDGNGYLDFNDVVKIGRSLPLFTGGFSTQMNIYGVDFSASFIYSYGNQAYNSLRSGMGYSYAPTFNARYQLTTNAMDDETRRKILDNNEKTLVQYIGAVERGGNSNYEVEDASFLRCREIYMGYAIPSKILRMVKLSNLKVYTTVSNPFIITNYTGYNPEIGSGSGLLRGVDTGAYPMSRTYSLGVIVGL